MMTNKCTLSASRFDGHGSAPKQYRRHQPMQHVQGYSRSHWMPALGNYSPHIAPASARASGKQTTIIKYTNKAGRFDGHRDAAVQYRVHLPMEEVQGFTRRHWMPPSASTCSDSNESDIAIPRFCYLLRVSGDGDDTIRYRMTYQWKAKDLANAREYFNSEDRNLHET